MQNDQRSLVIIRLSWGKLDELHGYTTVLETCNWIDLKSNCHGTADGYDACAVGVPDDVAGSSLVESRVERTT